MRGFLSLLLNGAIKDKETKAVQTSPKAGSDEGGVTDAETAEAAPRYDLYQFARFRKLAGIRDMINKIFLAVCDMGDEVRHNIETELPPTIPGGAQCPGPRRALLRVD